MKWVLSHTTDELHHWLLQEEVGSRSLTLHRQRLSLRLNGFSKRLFFLQVGGLLQKKILLRSEYGVVLSETSFADKSPVAPIIINGQKFLYQVEGAKLMLLDGEKNNLGECDVAPDAAQDKIEFYALLFGFAWFVTADALVSKTDEVLETL